MVNIDAINTLIDQVPTIKSLFAKENVTMFSSYDYKTRTRKNSGIELQTIYKNPNFLQWRERLYFELGQIKDDDYINDIIALAYKFNGWNDKTSFDKLEAKLSVLNEHLDKYKTECSTAKIKDDNRIPEKEICDKILRALSKLQRNHHYDTHSSEDTMNDYIRDVLDESYIIRDQTRQGESENGTDAGEVDMGVLMLF